MPRNGIAKRVQKVQIHPNSGLVTEEIVYIGIGSNLADPLEQVKQAIKHLQGLKQSSFLNSSSLYVSQPMGPEDQPDYINAAVSLSTRLPPLALLDQLQGIEANHGRVRNGQRWGPRTLDLDVLIYGENIINSERLVIPHPGLHERAFVLYPLHEINPELIIPGRASLAELIEHCPLGGLEKIIA